MTTQQDMRLRLSQTKIDQLQKLVGSEQTTPSAVSPSAISKYSAEKRFSKAEQPIYSSMERRSFVTDIFLMFSALQRLMKHVNEGWLRTSEGSQMLRKLGTEYARSAQERWYRAFSCTNRSKPSKPQSEHYRMLSSALSLFVILYMPEPGYEDALIAEELVDWMNKHFAEPSTEQGDMLNKLEKPWENTSFWSYLTKCILRGLTGSSSSSLKALLRHPSLALRDMVKLLQPLVMNQPHLRNFTSEREFVFAARRWRDQVKALRVEMDNIPERERTVHLDLRGGEGWWEKLSDIVSLLEGESQKFKQIIKTKFSGDWKEGVAAWSIFVDRRTRRESLPKIVAQMLDAMPSNSNNVEESLYIALLSGNLKEALRCAHTIDPWLSAHLIHFMVPLQLIDNEVIDKSGLSLRDHYVLSYAESLRSDPSLWRIMAGYMYSCDETGRRQADELLVHIPVRFRSNTANNGDEAASATGPEELDVLEDLNDICREHGREDLRRLICRIAAKTFIMRGEFNLAIAYMASGQDWMGLDRVIDYILESHITSGPVNLIHSESQISDMLNGLDLEGPLLSFKHRFTFVARYAELQRHLAHMDYAAAAKSIVSILSEGLAPRSWYAIILTDLIPLIGSRRQGLFDKSDAVLLLKRLDEIMTAVNNGVGEEYLGPYKRLLTNRRQRAVKNKTSVHEEVLNQLGIVRDHFDTMTGD